MKLSIIVPVYNVAPYLRKCVDSLLAQDYADYEIILVDDGSTDNSGAICDEYASRSSSNLLTLSSSHPSIRVIHQTNAGLSAARNAGLKDAKGEYVCFVDSDDYWQPNVLSELMAQIERDSLDVLRFKYQNVNEQYEVYYPYKSDPFNGNDYSGMPIDGVNFLNTRMNTACYAVMFIVRRDLLNDCMFTEGIYFEDTDWTPRMLCKAERVASTNTVVYNYLVRKGSITNAVNRSKQKKVLDDKMHLLGEMQKQADAMLKLGLCNAWYSRMIADIVVTVIGMLSTIFYAEKDSYLSRLQDLKVIPLKKKSIKARLINLSPRLAIELLHLKNG